MDYYPIIAANFQDTIETIAMSVDDLATVIERASQLMASALLGDHKIIVCGNGVDAAVAQLFTSNLLNASVTAIAQAGAFNDIFSRQLRARGQPGDVLLCINSSEAASNLLRAVQTAQEQGMGVIAMTSARDSVMGEAVRPEDVELSVNATRAARVVEMHTMAIHSFCELIDHSLFGTYNPE